MQVCPLMMHLQDERLKARGRLSNRPQCVQAKKEQIMSIDVKVPKKPLLYSAMDRPLVEDETLVSSCHKSNLNSHGFA